MKNHKENQAADGLRCHVFCHVELSGNGTKDAAIIQTAVAQGWTIDDIDHTAGTFTFQKKVPAHEIFPESKPPRKPADEEETPAPKRGPKARRGRPLKERKRPGVKRGRPPMEKTEPASQDEFQTVTRNGKTYKRRKRRFFKKLGSAPAAATTSPHPWRRKLLAKASIPAPAAVATSEDPMMEACDSCKRHVPMRYPCLDCGTSICSTCRQKGNPRKNQCKDCADTE